MDAISIILVTRNKLEPLKVLIDRIYSLTESPLELIIVDNCSEEPVRRYLRSLAAARENLKLILLGEGRYCCHATNLALSLCTNPVICFFCSREAFPMHAGWEKTIIEYMEDHPEVGIAGTLVEVPRYSSFDQLREMNFFQFFRNKQFAVDKGKAVFKHVQGGFYVLRKDLLKEVGFFNERLYHNYLDVEYSYYVESNGWKLGDITQIRCRHYWIYNQEEYDPKVAVYHPLDLPTLEQFDEQAKAGD